MDFYIMIDNQKIFVSEQIYKAYCQGKRKERYFRESDLHNQVYSYDALDSDDFLGCELFEDSKNPSVEALAEHHLLLNNLRQALKTLPEKDLQLLSVIYGQQKTFRQAAELLSLPLSTLYSRHQALLGHLRTVLENSPDA